MDDRLSRLESEVERLSQALKRVEDRLQRVEEHPGAPAVTPAPSAASVEGAVTAPSDSEIARGITFVGRTLLVLGGGYMLRALTESGALAPLGGVALGLAYALIWLLTADRAGAKGNTLSAAFHGGASVLVAFPLLWETTARFELLSPPISAGCLALVTAVAIAVAWRRRLRSFAWVTVVGATLTSLALLVGTRELAPFSLVLVWIALATVWLSYHAKWPAVHWVVAGMADLTVALVTVGVLVERSDVSPASAAAVQLTLFVSFVATFVYRVLRQSHEPRLFEALQSVFAVVLGYGGALLSAPGIAARLLGACGPALGIIAYVLSFSSTQSTRSSVYLSGLGLTLVVLGSLALFDEPTVLLALSGAVLSWIGFRFQHTVSRLHGALLLVVAAVTSGLLMQGAHAFLAGLSSPWPPLTVWVATAFAGAAFAYALPWTEEDERWFVRRRLARILVLLVLVWGAGGAVLEAFAGRSPDAGILATMRTTVLAASALGLGWLGRHAAYREASWLVYPVLVAGGIKLLIEDFPQGRPATLFAALALYGGALILAPRVARSSS